MAAPLENAIESVLFFSAEPMTLAALSDAVSAGESEVRAACSALAESLRARGVRLVESGDTVALRAAPDAADLLEVLARAELGRELGRAGLETLTVILYFGPAPRATIDYVRGVHSGYIVRHLIRRGLIEKTHNPNDARAVWYRPTIELLAHLGISKVEELPEYAATREEIRAFFAESEKEGREETATSETQELV